MQTYGKISLLQTVDHGRKWNVIERSGHKGGGSDRKMPNIECLLFDQLKAKLSVEDNLDYSQPLKFIWDNCRSREEGILKRLDRIYFPYYHYRPNSWILKFYYILANMQPSNHLVVMGCVKLCSQQKKLYLQNKSHLSGRPSNEGGTYKNLEICAQKNSFKPLDRNLLT